MAEDKHPTQVEAPPKDSTENAQHNDAKLQAEPLTSEHTNNFPGLLRQLGVSLLVTTYQAGRVILVRDEGELLNTHFRSLPKPMGLATSGDGRRFAVGTAGEIKLYRNVPALAGRIESERRHDAAYVPFSSQVTGDIDIHEMAFDKRGELWFINTRFSSLCTRDNDNHFVPHWRPPFVTALAPEDRCHLNGLGMREGKPRYVTALGTSDKRQGWREDKAHGGMLMDLNKKQIMVAGLSMPHSPRWYNDKLWVLESGVGSLATVEPATGKVTTVAKLPGFTRGISFHGPLAFIGLSQVRESAVFSGIPITERLQPEERSCGVWVVNILNGETVAYLKFTGGVREIFAVEVVPHRYPEMLEPGDKLLMSTYVIPDAAMQDVESAP